MDNEPTNDELTRALWACEIAGQAQAGDYERLRAVLRGLRERRHMWHTNREHHVRRDIDAALRT